MFYYVVEIGEFEWVVQIEYWGVVVDQVLVVLFGVEMYGEVVDVLFGICCVMFIGDGGEVQEYIGFFVDLGEDFCLGVGGDVMGDGEGVVGCGVFCMYVLFGDYFVIEVGEFFEELYVL